MKWQLFRRSNDEVKPVQTDVQWIDGLTADGAPWDNDNYTDDTSNQNEISTN